MAPAVPTSRALSLWLPVVLWAGVIFALSSIQGLNSGIEGWDTPLRKAAHAVEFAILGLLLVRASRHEAASVAAGVAYACTDELHQHFVRDRAGRPVDVLIDAFGVVLGVLAFRRARAE